jgi:hypothetical protein
MMQAQVRSQTHQVWRDSAGHRQNHDGEAAFGRGLALVWWLWTRRIAPPSLAYQFFGAETKGAPLWEIATRICCFGGGGRWQLIRMLGVL